MICARYAAVWMNKLVVQERIDFAFVRDGVLIINRIFLSLQPNPFCLDKQSALAYKLSNPLTSSTVYDPAIAVIFCS